MDKSLILDLLSIRRDTAFKQEAVRVQRKYDQDKESETFAKMLEAGLMDVTRHKNGLGANNPGPKKLFVLFEILKDYGYSHKDIYKLNKFGFRSDEFINNHYGKHIIFAGCSYTFGDSVFLADSWAYKVYLEIAKKETLSGYFNLGSPGASTQECIDQIFNYVNIFGNPQAIFLLMPNAERGKINESYEDLYSSIAKLSTYCQENNIDLFMSSWDAKEFSEKDLYQQAAGYVPMDLDKMTAHVDNFYDKHSGHLLKDFFLYAFDLEHPGIAIHDYYKHFFYNLYKGNNQ